VSALKPLGDQTIVIVGATSGIGLRTFQRARASGAKLFLISRDQEQMERMAAEMPDRGVAHAVADVADADALQRAAEKAVETFGPIDSWLHVAGVAVYGDLLDIAPQDHERLFATNYWGVVNASRVAIPRLNLDAAVFAVVGSIASRLPTPVLGAYAASKHAARGYVESLRVDLLRSHPGITVSMVHPSGIATPLARHAAVSGEGQPRIPPPAYDPDFVARALLRCAVHRTRDLTVGGVGRAQVLAQAMAPGLSDRLNSALAPTLIDRSKAYKPAAANLYGPGKNGLTGREGGRYLPISPYTEIKLRPLMSAGLATLGLAASFIPAHRPRRPWPL